MSCQPHRAPEVSQTQVISKCTFKKTLLISKCLVKSVHKILLISKRLVKLVHKTNHFANMKQNIHTKTSNFFWEKRIIKHQDKPNTSNACFHMDDFLQYFLQYAIFYNTTGPLLWRAVENSKALPWAWSTSWAPWSPRPSGQACSSSPPRLQNGFASPQPAGGQGPASAGQTSRCWHQSFWPLPFTTKLVGCGGREKWGGGGGGGGEGESRPHRTKTNPVRKDKYLNI